MCSNVSLGAVVPMRATQMLGGRTGAEHPRAGSATPKLITFPPESELKAMSRDQLAALNFSEVAWKARGGLDGLQFTLSDGRRSPFYGAAPSLNGSAGRFGASFAGKTST